jgi:flagellar hook-associated protein 2
MANASSIVSALGAGSGIDMAALARNLATAQFQLRTERLAAKSETLERQISSAASIKSTLSLLANALGDRVRSGDLSPRASVAAPSVASASSPLGTTGKGSYTLEVLALASPQTLTTPSFASASSPVGAGSLTFRFGTTSASSFTDSGREPLTIDIASGATLADVAAAINGKNAGVSAYVAQTITGAQLVLKGQEGAANGFIIEPSETPGEEGLAALAWNPAAGGAPAQMLSSAGDASFKLDGLAMTSASNATGQVAPGLALTLTGTNAGAPTQISFAEPEANLTAAMSDFVAALNEVTSQLRSATDPLTGDLARDPGARALQRTLSQFGTTVIMPSAADGAPRTLADLGVAIQRDGSFRLDTAVLQAALARDPAGVAAMFTPGLNGVYASLDRISRDAGKTGDPGSLGGSIARYQAQSSKVGADSTSLAEKQEALRASLTARFAKADSRIGASQSTLSFLKAQIDAWNGSRE